MAQIGQHRAREGFEEQGGGGEYRGDEEEEEEEEQQQRQEVIQARQLGTASQLLAGGIAGAVSKSCTAPLARLTILFQIQGMRTQAGLLRKPSILREASRIAFEEGFGAFWKGNAVTIVHRLPYSAISFFSYEKYKMGLIELMDIDTLQDGYGVGMGTRLLAGGAAGITASSLTYPLDLVRTRLAAQTTTAYYKGMTHALTTISREEGIRGLYKGLGATLLQVGPNIAINFCVYETLKSRWNAQRPETPGAWVSLGCGSLAGFVSSTVTFPLDLVRRRKQLEGAQGRANVYNAGLFGTFRHIFRMEGFKGLYRGIVPEYAKVVPSVGIVFLTYEFMKNFLAQWPPP